MKTAMRTYHPIPSLQTDETSKKDLSDAPRIKGILKASLLDWEMKQQPSCLQDIAKKLVSNCQRLNLTRALTNSTDFAGTHSRSPDHRDHRHLPFVQRSDLGDRQVLPGLRPARHLLPEQVSRRERYFCAESRR